MGLISWKQCQLPQECRPALAAAAKEFEHSQAHPGAEEGPRVINDFIRSSPVQLPLYALEFC